MSSEAPVSPTTVSPEPVGWVRPAWNQKLIDAACGIKLSIRSDSSFFVHFFTGCLILLAAMILGLGPLEWTILVLALTIVITAELFGLALKTLLTGEEDEPLPAAVTRAVRIGTAAAMVAWIGGTLCVLLLFGVRVVAILQSR